MNSINYLAVISSSKCYSFRQVVLLHVMHFELTSRRERHSTCLTFEAVFHVVFFNMALHVALVLGSVRACCTHKNPVENTISYEL